MLGNFRTYQLALAFAQECQNIKIKGPLKDQLERAASSIVLNLAEGSAKPTVKDRKRFYYISFGSLREVQAILDLLQNQNLKIEADRLAAHLYKLCRA